MKTSGLIIVTFLVASLNASNNLSSHDIRDYMDLKRGLVSDNRDNKRDSIEKTRSNLNYIRDYKSFSQNFQINK